MIDKKQIPQHWELKTLGEVCYSTSGGTPNRSNSKFYKGSIPWVKSGELNRGLILDTEERITEEAIKNSSAKIFPKGTLLIALYGATIGKLAFLGIDAATNQAVCGIFKNEIINSYFLYHFLFYKKPSLVKQGIGGAQPNISQGILKNLELPIPPLPEQQAIVSKIEELFSELENGRRQLQIAQQQLKVYRQSLLKWAFEGKLTNKNVKEGELPEGWKWVRVQDISIVSTGVTPLRSNILFWNKGNIPWITSGALNNLFVDKAEEFISEMALKEKNLKLLPKHSLLVALYGEGKTRGKCSELLIESTTNQAIAGIVLREEFKQSKNFLKLFLLKNYNDIRRLSSGGVQPNLNLSIVKNTKLPFPSEEEQLSIVQELESKLTVCDKIEETISQSLQQAEVLRQSILKKAFEGKLI